MPQTGESHAIVPSTTTVTHGVAMTPDSRYAFVSVEGKGAEPGKVDVYDLQSFQMVGSVGVGQQAGGSSSGRWSRRAERRRVGEEPSVAPSLALREAPPRRSVLRQSGSAPPSWDVWKCTAGSSPW